MTQELPQWWTPSDTSTFRGATDPAGAAGNAFSGAGGGGIPTTASSWGAVGSDLASLLMGSPYSDYASSLGEISPELEKYLSQARGYLSPYYKAGTGALDLYSQKMKEMSDPTAFYSKIMGGYQESPAYKFRMQQGLESLKNTAAATGYTGSGHELKNILGFSQGLASQGQQQYLQNILGINTADIAGLSQLSGRGQQAGSQMGEWGMQTGTELASIRAQQAAAEAKAKQQEEAGIGSLFGDVAKIPAIADLF